MLPWMWHRPGIMGGMSFKQHTAGVGNLYVARCRERSFLIAKAVVAAFMQFILPTVARPVDTQTHRSYHEYTLVLQIRFFLRTTNASVRCTPHHSLRKHPRTFTAAVAVTFVPVAALERTCSNAADS
jgi:hypothetical protein